MNISGKIGFSGKANPLSMNWHDPARLVFGLDSHKGDLL